MYLYLLLFLSSCLSTKSRYISSVDYYWYAGFDQRLTSEEDSYWSPKLYYSPALDNLRRFGTYSYIEKNDQRNYLKDSFNPKSTSLFPTVEKLLLNLFPSPYGSLSITSNSNSNINKFISQLPEGEIDKNNHDQKIFLTKEDALIEILNIVYNLLHSKEMVITKTMKAENNTAILKLKKIFKTVYNEHSSEFILKGKLDINLMINSLLNPLKDFLNIPTEEKQLIQHAFMKWALMHVGIANTQKIHRFINRLHFFKNDLKKNQLSKSEELFQKAKIGFIQPSNIYLDFIPFENGSIYALNKEGKQTNTVFSDCTETTLRHFFNYVLKEKGKYHILESFNSKLRDYYKDANDEKVLRHDIISRTDWNKVVSHIPGAQYNIDGNELFPNISNILYVIEYLLTNEKKETFEEFSSDVDVEQKFKNIENILNKIKPIELTTCSEKSGKYILNNFFIINIDENHHAFASIKPDTEKNKKETDIFFKHLNHLEYSFLTNFFTFNAKEFNIKKKNIIPLFYSSIYDISTIEHFLKQSNKLNTDDLNHFSPYIGRVLYSALWEDESISQRIYRNDNLIELLEKSENASHRIEEILNGVRRFVLDFSYENEVLLNKLSSFLFKNLQLFKRFKILDTNNFPSSQLQSLINIINENKDFIKEIVIRDQKKEVGQILEAIFDCINIKKLKIKDSVFENPLSSKINHLTNLEELKLLNNRIDGFIPDLSNLNKLRILSLHANRFYGEIPKTLSKLTELVELDLSYNSLYRSIPSELGNLNKLRKLILRGNYLTNNIPETLSQLVNLQLLHLQSNSLIGNIPKGLKKFISTINPQIDFNNSNTNYDLNLEN